MLVLVLEKQQPDIVSDLVVVRNKNIRNVLSQWVIYSLDEIPPYAIDADVLHVPSCLAEQYPDKLVQLNVDRIVADFTIKTVEDFEHVLKSPVSMYGIWTCLRYVDTTILSHVASNLHKISLLYNKKAHQAYLSRKEIECSCIYVNNDYFYCPHKKTSGSLEELMVIKCTMCPWFDGYEYVYIDEALEE